MSSHPGNTFNQDDVLGNNVERGAFQGGYADAAHRESAEVVAKPKSALKFLLKLGGVILGALALVFAVMLFLGSRNSGGDDASFQQASAPAPQPVISPPAPNTAGSAQAPIGPQPTPEVPVAAGPAASAELGVISDEASGISSPPAPPTEPNPATAEANSAPPAAQASMPAPPVAPAIAQTAAQTTSESDAAKLERLEDTIEALRGDVARLTQAKNAADRRRAAAARNTPSRSSPPTRKPAAEPAAPTRVSGVVLKAVVDKNAWVQVDSGESVMVAPGDRIPGVGVVQSVNPESATVRLSDGRVIK